MNDANTTVQKLKKEVSQFVREHDWDKYHSLKNLSMSIAIEAAELMEKFQWIDAQASENDRLEIEHELVDILSYVLSFAHFYNVDLSAAIARKIAILEKRYPVEKVKGRYDIKKLAQKDTNG